METRKHKNARLTALFDEHIRGRWRRDEGFDLLPEIRMHEAVASILKRLFQSDLSETIIRAGIRPRRVIN